MEVRKAKEVFTELREVKSPGDRTIKERAALSKLSETKDAEETAELRILKREEGFRMIKGGKGYTIADIEALPEGERAELIDGGVCFGWMHLCVFIKTTRQNFL